MAAVNENVLNQLKELGKRSEKLGDSLQLLLSQ